MRISYWISYVCSSDLIGLFGLDRLAPHVVKAQHQVGVARKSLGGRDILDAVLFPQAAGVAKRVDAAFGGHAGAGQDDDIVILSHGPSYPFASSEVETPIGTAHGRGASRLRSMRTAKGERKIGRAHV